MTKTQALIEIAEIICKNCTKDCSKKKCKDLNKVYKILKSLDADMEDDGK